MAVFSSQTVNASARIAITANGTSRVTGTLTWTAPPAPASVISLTSIHVRCDMYTWSGKGNFTLTINGTSAESGKGFDIALPTNATSPYTITGVGGNRNATDANCSFTNLMVVYTYQIEGGEEYIITASLVGNGAISPDGSTTVNEGDSFSLYISADSEASIAIMDNGIDVTHLLQNDSLREEFYAKALTNSTGASLTGSENIYGVGVEHSLENDLILLVNNGGKTFVNFNVGNFTGSGTFKVSCAFESYTVNTNGLNAYAQLYSGDAPIGDAFEITHIKERFQIDGLISSEELSSLRLVFYTDPSYQFCFPALTTGVTLLVESGAVATYTIDFVQSDHAIIVTVTDGGVSTELTIKVNGTWTPVLAAYKKVNGAWIKQDDLQSLFDENNNYVVNY